MQHLGHEIQRVQSRIWVQRCMPGQAPAYILSHKNLCFTLYTRVIQKVCRVTHLITRYIYHILSLFNIIYCNWNALGPAFFQSSNSTAEEWLILLFQLAIFFTYNVFIISNFAFFHEFIQFRSQSESPLANMIGDWVVESGVSDGSQHLRWRVNRCVVLVKQHSAA